MQLGLHNQESKLMKQPVIAKAFNDQALEKAGHVIRQKFALAAADRVVIEQQWLRNLRQYKKEYDPDVADLIPKERSKVYPGDTYKKVTGFEAKMMEMMFPATEKNFAIVRTPFPSIDQEDLQNIINGLRQHKSQAAMQQAQQAQQQGQQVPPPNPEDLEPTSEEIEKAVDVFADARADMMTKECEDQLAEIDYPDIAKRALRGGAIYGCGITEGPLVKLEDVREWMRDEQGHYQAETKKLARPMYEPCQIWDIFPDLAAKQWDDQEGIFQRKVFTRHMLTALKDRPDFFGDKIDQFLSENRDGNYKSRTYENDLNILKKIANLNKRDSRRYEVIRYYGFLSSHDLVDMGVDIPTNKMGMDLLVDFWLLDNIPIKGGFAAFGKKPSDMFHAYVHMDDEDSGLTGVGIPVILRDSQMSRCAVRRMLMDNSAAVAGPIFGVDHSKLARGYENQQIHSFTTMHFESEDVPNFRISDVMQQFSTDAHISDLLAFEARLKEDIDEESNLPSWTLGNAQPLGEAFRTSQNMSQMTGGANVILKDNVRAFDRYTRSLIGSLLEFNMDPELNPKKEIKGDFNVQPRGTISLVTKEVRGQALDQLASMLTPQDRMYINNRLLLIERMKSRDLDPDLVKSQEECDAADAQQAQMAAQKSQMEDQVNQAKAGSLQAKAQKDTTDAQVAQEQNQAQISKILAEVQSKLADSTVKKGKLDLEHIQTLMEDLRERSLGKQQIDAQKERATNGGKSAGQNPRPAAKTSGQQAL
jgi:hypothetical protein